MYTVAFATPSGVQRKTIVQDSDSVYAARKAVAARKDCDLVISCDKVSPEDEALYTLIQATQGSDVAGDYLLDTFASAPFKDLGHADRSAEDVKSRLVLPLPITTFRPESMRVTERIGTETTWHEVETFSVKMGKWIAQKTHSAVNDAIADALAWYPAPAETANNLTKRAIAPKPQEGQTIKVLILPTQEDIVNFENGKKPGNVLEREFYSEVELAAYKNGIDVIEDEFDEIDGLNVVGSIVSFTRPTDESNDADIQEIVFGTHAEAEAYRQGIDDSEGFRSPMLIEQSDENFDLLTALIAKSEPSNTAKEAKPKKTSPGMGM